MEKPILWIETTRNIFPQRPIHLRRFCIDVCSGCIARVNPQEDKNGVSDTRLNSNNEIIAEAEIKCTSLLPDGEGKFTERFTYTDGTLEEAMALMDKIQSGLSCNKFPDLIKIPLK